MKIKTAHAQSQLGLLSIQKRKKKQRESENTSPKQLGWLVGQFIRHDEPTWLYMIYMSKERGKREREFLPGKSCFALLWFACRKCLLLFESENNKKSNWENRKWSGEGGV